MEVNGDLLDAVNELNNKAMECLSNGDAEGAVVHFTQVIELSPPDEILAATYHKRAGAHQMLQKWLNVIEDTTQALERKPFYLETLLRRFEAYKITERLDEALHDLVYICFIGGETSIIASQIDKLLTAVGKAEAEELFKARQPSVPSKQLVANFLEDFSSDPVTRWWNGELTIPALQDGSGDSDLRLIPVSASVHYLIIWFDSTLLSVTSGTL